VRPRHPWAWEQRSGGDESAALMRDETDLLGEAKALTSLSDFGNDSFREGLQLLVGSLRREAKLNSLGEAVQTYLIINLLSQRLQVEVWYRRHPDIDDEPIRRPLIGLGLPRTGSTALSFLLSLDADARSLRRWEASEPCPPPSTVSGTDPRIARAEARIAAFKEMVPRISDFKALISHSRPIENQGGSLVYEVPINKAHCTSGFLG
jgi:hypothetical protein